MEQQDINNAIVAAGAAPPDAPWTVAGSDPFFRSPLPLATGASAALVALGGAIERLHRARGGPDQHISVDAQHAALSLLSMWLLRVEGELALTRLSDGGPALFGQFPTRDGKVLHLQPGLPHHVEATLRTLDCAGDSEAVAAAVAGHDGEPVETALAEAGVPAVLVRDEATWKAHPQGVAMAGVPVVEIERIGEAEPLRRAPADRPLTGVRILDLTRVLAGPTCARTLGEYGADVLHVDSPNLLDLTAGQADTAHGKRMTWLDLEQPRDHDRLAALAGEADVFVQSYRAGSLARRGFGPEEMARRRPGIIYVSVNCYGHHGPWKTRPGYDGNAMAATGITHLHDEGPGPDIAVAMNDYSTAWWGAYGAIEALRRQATEGGSWSVRVSLVQSAMWFLRLPRRNDGETGFDGEHVYTIADQHLVTEASPYGELRQLPPALHLSATPPLWQRGTPLPGSSAAEWLPR